MQLNWLDYTIVALIVFSTGAGLIRGLLREISPLVGLILALVISYRLGPELQPFVTEWIGDSTMAYVLCFVVVFGAAWVLLSAVGAVLTKILKATPAWPLDKLLGGALGLVRGVAVSVILVVALLAFLPPGSKSLRESVLAPGALSIGRVAISLMPEDTKLDLKHRYDRFRSKAQKARRVQGAQQRIGT